MESFPFDVLAFLGSKLSLEDILSFATSNSQFRKIFLEPSINRQLAEYFSFPYNLSLVELKRFEDMSWNKRLEEAAKTGDLRLVKDLIQISALPYNEVMNAAAFGGHRKIMERVMEVAY